MLSCFYQADNSHNQSCDGTENRDDKNPAENTAHNAEYERAYRQIILFMLQLVNDYRPLGINLRLLSIAGSGIGWWRLLPAVILARVRGSLGRYILLIGILLALLVRIRLVRILLIGTLLIRILLVGILLESLVIIIVDIIVIIHLITPVCFK